MVVAANISDNSQQAQIVDWINARYDDFIEILLQALTSDDESFQVAC
jgi:hypothetical protein